MIGVSDKYVACYKEKLIAQKNIYEQILALSNDERQQLNTKPLRLNKVIELLHQKNELLNIVHRLEAEIVPVRSKVLELSLSDSDRDSISAIVQQISHLLEQLISSDADNEQLLQDTMGQGMSPKPVNKTYAMNAYKTCAR